MQGMTMKQYKGRVFLDLVEQYRRLKANLSGAAPGAFASVSVRLHAAKGDVPKRWHSMINRG